MIKKEPRNPFYLLLVIAGMLFVVTGCAYGVVAVRELGPRVTDSRSNGVDASAGESDSGRSLVDLMNRYGLQLLGGELTLLAIGTAGAIWLDSARQKRSTSDKSSS